MKCEKVFGEGGVLKCSVHGLIDVIMLKPGDPISDIKNAIDEAWCEHLAQQQESLNHQENLLLRGELTQTLKYHQDELIGCIVDEFDWIRENYAHKSELEKRDSVIHEMENAIHGYASAIAALGEKSPSGKLYFEADTTKDEEAAKRWIALNRAGKNAQEALARAKEAGL